MEYITPENIARDTVYNGGGTYRITDTPLGYAYQAVTADSFDHGDAWAVGSAHGLPTITTNVYGIRDAVGYMAENVAGNIGHGFLGTWIDPDTGIAHIDAVTIIPDRDNALAMARYYGELAIYNITTGETVYTNLVPEAVR